MSDGFDPYEGFKQYFVGPTVEELLGLGASEGVGSDPFGFGLSQDALSDPEFQAWLEKNYPETYLGVTQDGHLSVENGFQQIKAGDYTYVMSPDGKTAIGVLDAAGNFHAAGDMNDPLIRGTEPPDKETSVTDWLKENKGWLSLGSGLAGLAGGYLDSQGRAKAAKAAADAKNASDQQFRDMFAALSGRAAGLGAAGPTGAPGGGGANIQAQYVDPMVRSLARTNTPAPIKKAKGGLVQYAEGGSLTAPSGFNYSADEIRNFLNSASQADIDAQAAKFGFSPEQVQNIASQVGSSYNYPTPPAPTPAAPTMMNVGGDQYTQAEVKNWLDTALADKDYSDVAQEAARRGLTTGQVADVFNQAYGVKDYTSDMMAGYAGQKPVGLEPYSVGKANEVLWNAPKPAPVPTTPTQTFDPAADLAYRTRGETSAPLTDVQQGQIQADVDRLTTGILQGGDPNQLADYINRNALGYNAVDAVLDRDFGGLADTARPGGLMTALNQFAGRPTRRTFDPNRPWLTPRLASQDFNNTMLTSFYNPNEQQIRQTGGVGERLYAAGPDKAVGIGNILRQLRGGAAPTTTTPTTPTTTGGAAEGTEAKKFEAIDPALWEGRTRPEGFTEAGYLAKNPDLRKQGFTESGMGLINHYLTHGIKEGRQFASGGQVGALEGIAQDPVVHRYMRGGTGGQDDKIPALLSDGEYVMDADVVSALGDGNNAAGAAKLDKMRENIRMHKRSASPKKIPPKAKAPEQYMKGKKNG